MIDRLKAEGYQFVLVSSLAGLTRDQSMPALTPSFSLYADRVVFLADGLVTGDMRDPTVEKILDRLKALE